MHAIYPNYNIHSQTGQATVQPQTGQVLYSEIAHKKENKATQGKEQVDSMYQVKNNDNIHTCFYISVFFSFAIHLCNTQ